MTSTCSVTHFYCNSTFHACLKGRARPQPCQCLYDFHSCMETPEKCATTDTAEFYSACVSYNRRLRCDFEGCPAPKVSVDNLSWEIALTLSILALLALCFLSIFILYKRGVIFETTGKIRRATGLPIPRGKSMRGQVTIAKIEDEPADKTATELPRKVPKTPQELEDEAARALVKGLELRKDQLITAEAGADAVQREIDAMRSELEAISREQFRNEKERILDGFVVGEKEAEEMRRAGSLSLGRDSTASPHYSPVLEVPYQRSPPRFNGAGPSVNNHQQAATQIVSSNPISNLFPSPSSSFAPAAAPSFAQSNSRSALLSEYQQQQRALVHEQRQQQQEDSSLDDIPPLHRGGEATGSSAFSPQAFTGHRESSSTTWMKSPSPPSSTAFAEIPGRDAPPSRGVESYSISAARAPGAYHTPAVLTSTGGPPRYPPMFAPGSDGNPRHFHQN